jgi:uncharacterized membrane protein YfhO
VNIYRNPEALPPARIEHPRQCGGEDVVEIRARNRFEVRAACPGVLVVSQTWFPGWTALVDARPAKVHQVHGALQGVELDSGHHTIELRYRPASACLGAFGSLLGLALALWAARSAAA